jgi:hypothetical protein
MGFSRGPKIVTDGLVLALDAGSKKSYPGSGTTWKDLSGNGNTGTLVNGPTFDSGNGGSIVFDGVNDYVNEQASDSFGISNDISLECWFSTTKSYGTNSSTTAGRIINLHQSDPGTNISIQVGSDGLGFFHRGSNQFYADNIPVNTGSWIHGVVVVDENNTKLYRNTLVAVNVTTSNLFTFSSYPLIIGSFEGSTRFFEGNLGIAKIYNRALSAEEILQNYNATKSRFGV